MITSTGNARVKRVRLLHSDRRAREAEGVLLVEGPRLLREALLAGVRPEVMFYTEDFADDVSGMALLEEAGVEPW